jgi:hypothetical protein
MKTPAEIASHPKACLHRDIVARLRDSGSIKGAERTWARLRLNPRLWKRIITYGLGLPDRQAQLNKIAFPDSNAAEVDAALRAGNNLSRLYELACGRASLAADSAGHYKRGAKGLKIIPHVTALAARGRDTGESRS